MEDAELHLAEMFLDHANNDEFGIDTANGTIIARKELRSWIKRGLVVEREGNLMATDALQQCMHFIDGLDNRIMTSSASRLATVQREIENLETLLNPDPKARARYIKQKIKALEIELKQVQRGHVDILDESQAVEHVQEVYNLAMSLRADFRRIEDSYREADRHLRQSIVSEQQHRGEVVDSLLDTHDNLLDTVEGQVFHGFHEQLNRSVELDNMKHRLRNILRNPAARKALNTQQQTDLRWIIIRLVRESANVIRARARSEKDVKSFLKTGLAAEHHRVGQLLNDILEAALDIDWQDSKTCRQPAALPPVATGLGSIPTIERLRFKSLDNDSDAPLELSEHSTNLNDIDDDFWDSFDTLDRHALFQDTLGALSAASVPMGLKDLSTALPPSHDLETLAFWLSLGQEAEIPISNEREQFNVVDRDGKTLRFDVPKTALTSELIQSVDWE